MASAVSVWKGQKKPLCDFLLSQYRNQPVARSDCLMSLTPFFAASTVTVLGLHLTSALKQVLPMIDWYIPSHVLAWLSMTTAV